VDTVEDRQSQEESDVEERDIANADWSAAIQNGNGIVVGDRSFRNTRTLDVQQQSMTTAAAQNMGELTHTDVDKERTELDRYWSGSYQNFVNRVNYFPFTLSLVRFYLVMIEEKEN
jgi:hypothetical protein